MHLNRWLSDHAQNRPHKTAVVTPTERITYKQLEERVAARAAELAELGVEAQDRVATLSANRIELLEVFLACARLGAVFAPLNTRLTPTEWGRILLDCQPRVLFVEEALLGQAPRHAGVQTLRPGQTGRRYPLQPVDAHSPVAILYTGGTTGVPKGAVLTHETIYWNARNTVEGWGFQENDRAPIFTPMFHTGGLNVMLTPLLYLGGTVVLTGPFEAESALQLIEQEQCTLLFLVPTMFQMLVESPLFHPERLSSVRQMISGGAPCPQALFQRYWKHRLPLRQGYGLSEAGPNNFGATVEDAQQRPGTVGKPLPYVEMKLTPEGELLIRGPHVMPGYWQRREESEAVLKDGWLYTGDLARVDEDGYYYINGRRKEMFISGGENVFPAEVEEVLLQHPLVAEAAVVGVPHPTWGEVGRAYLVPRAPLSPDEVVAFCRDRLARYKTPKEVVLLEQLPKSPAGKILKRELCNV